MIKKLSRFTQRIDSLKATVMKQIVFSSMDENKEEIADLVTGQLSEGIDGDGDDLAEYRSDEYASFKKSIGSKSSPIADLKLTGSFHSSIGLKTTKNSASITATDSKDEALSLKYGEGIKRLTEESKIEARLQIKEDIQLKINRLIFNR